MQGNTPAWQAAVASLAQLHVDRRGPHMYAKFAHRYAHTMRAEMTCHGATALRSILRFRRGTVGATAGCYSVRTQASRTQTDASCAAVVNGRIISCVSSVPLGLRAPQQPLEPASAPGSPRIKPALRGWRSLPGCFSGPLWP